MTGFWSGAGAGLLGALGSGLNIAFSGISSSRASKYAIRAMNHQDYLNRQFTKDQYALMREGLAKGGYNPLLAVTSGMSPATPSSIGSGVGSDSDIASEGISSAIDAVRLRNETVANNANVQKINAEKKGIELENRKLQKELNTSPRGIISDFLEGNDNATTRFIKSVGHKLGITVPNSANSINNKIPTVILHDSKPYVQKGVPRSVVRSFNNTHSNSAIKSNQNTYRLHYLNDIEDVIKKEHGRGRPYKPYTGKRGKVINLPNIT